MWLFTRNNLKRLMHVRFIVPVVFVLILMTIFLSNPRPTIEPEKVPAAQVEEEILYTFNVDGVLHETGSEKDSRSPYWWLDSGGQLVIKNGVGETMLGALSPGDIWYKEYTLTNPVDTDKGARPQNLFRLVSRSIWNDVRVEASFYIVHDNPSASENRNESNGLLVMSRYMDDGQTLYYSGIRVDGTAVIKKKYKGTYYTMAQKQIFPGVYNRNTNPNLIPHETWIRLRTDTVTNKDKTVTVILSMEDFASSTWQELLRVTDKSQYEKTPPITGSRPVGLRTDFMDVRFDDILMKKL